MTDRTASLAHLQHQLGRLLLTGVLVAAACLSFGLLVYVIEPASRTASWLLNGGLIVLMATPILRVVISAVEYVRMSDWFFAVTTVIVLLELALTLVFAFTR